MSTCQEAVLISKYVYSRPTYLYTNIQTFDNVWLKWLKTTVPRDNSERNNTAARVQHCIQQGKAAVNFSIHTYIHTYSHTYIQTDRQTDIHTYTQTDRQTDRQTDIHTYTHRQTYIHTYMIEGVPIY